MNTYIIGTGWWCDGTGRHAGSIQNHMQSTDFIRKKDFFKLWYHFVNKYTNPLKIIIIDSNSPVKPKLLNDSRIEFLSMRKNFGHPVDSLKKQTLSGASRAVLEGAFYSYLNDVDYFIYIEQDCLIYGQGWPERCFEKMKNKKIMYGAGEGTPQPQQMSLMILKREFIPVFINKFIKNWDKTRRLLKKGQNQRNYSPERRLYKLFKKNVDLLPFGYGRVRPINFDDMYFYAQYLSKEELEKFLIKEGIEASFL